MAKYRCKVCGWIFDEEKEGITFEELTECYLCSAPKSEFEKVEDDGADAGVGTAGAAGIPASGGNELAVARRVQCLLAVADQPERNFRPDRAPAGYSCRRMPVAGYFYPHP